jgi:hypothetical protein
LNLAVDVRANRSSYLEDLTRMPFSSQLVQCHLVFPKVDVTRVA